MLMPDDGFVKIYRSIIKWDWYDDANTFRLFFHCILKANYEDREWHGLTIKRGSFVTSYGKLAKELKLSIKQIRTALNRLKRAQDVAQKSTSRYSIITVTNYEKYQHRGTDLAHRWHSEGTQRATTKERKKERNKEYSYKKLFKKLEEQSSEEGIWNE